MTQVTGASSGFAAGERPIDLVHLSRMSLGDRTLEREALQLFDRQTSLLMSRMRQIAPGGLAAAAHMLKGSASGIGAWQVARAAQAVEVAAGNSSGGELRAALDWLRRAADEARVVIADLLLPS